MVSAAPAEQQRLLHVQALDTALAQLAHRRRTLPELAQLAELAGRTGALHSRAVQLQTELSDIAGEQRRLENDIDVVRTRETRDQQRLDAGGIPAKELERLGHELQTLARRQSTLEDATLDVMERREEIETALAAVVADQATAAAEQADAEAGRDRAMREIDAAATATSAERADSARDIGPDLLGLYDKVREAQGGIGAAALHQRRCQGCRLELAGNELGRVRQAAADEVLRCENCRRILIRTPDSGL